MGIVSATGRSHLGIEDYEDFIQTDAPINPGNSGGALVNDRGELIGINTAILAHGSGGNQGIGFAIPVNMARNVMDQLVKTGKVTRAYMGILPQDVTPAIANAFGDKEARGALVGDVTANSPAQKSGIQKGDIILQVNGKPVADSNALRMAISMMQPDSNVNLRILRNGAQQDVAVQLGELPTDTAARSNTTPTEKRARSVGRLRAESGRGNRAGSQTAVERAGRSGDQRQPVERSRRRRSAAGRRDSGSESQSREEHFRFRACGRRLEREHSAAGESERQHDVSRCLIPLSR